MAAGTVSVRSLLMLDIGLAAAGNGDSDVTMTRPYDIYDTSVLCTASQTGGSAVLQLFRQALGSGGFTAITNTIACATAGLIGRTTTLAIAQRTLAATDVLRATVSGETGGSTANGKVFVLVHPLPILTSPSGS